MLIYVREEAVPSIFAPVPDSAIPEQASSCLRDLAQQEKEWEVRSEEQRYVHKLRLVTDDALRSAALQNHFSIFQARKMELTSISFDRRKSCALFFEKVAKKASVKDCEPHLYTVGSTIQEFAKDQRMSLARDCTAWSLHCIYFHTRLMVLARGSGSERSHLGATWFVHVDIRCPTQA
jgi:hypothetical protein